MHLGTKRNRDEDTRIMNMASTYYTSILATRTNTTAKSRVFECKTCNRKFSSFQALGGHRASHKKSKITESTSSLEWDWAQQPHQISKAKAHECSICGLEFSMGQALGGHMRKHRLSIASCETGIDPTLSLSTTTICRPSAPIVKTGRTLCLDLNLAPPGNNGLDFQLEKVMFPFLH